MKKYIVEVDAELNTLIEENAKKQNIAVEKFIAQILNRFVISPHILDNEDVKNAYKESGDVNLDWANL